MKKQLLFLLLFFFGFFVSAGFSFAARNLYITSDKSSLSVGDELDITASPSGFTNGEKVYVKGAFFKEGSSNYFGLTKNNDTWIKNSTSATSQREIIIGSWDNHLIIKPDFEDSGFADVGDYKFKLGFYFLNSSGNVSSINWSSNEINIRIDSAPSEAPISASSKFTTSSNTASNTNKIPTPTRQSGSVIPSTSKLAISSKTDEEFAKISRTIRSASEYAQIKPVTNIESKKKRGILGTKDTRTYVPVLFISGVVFLLAGLSSFIIKTLRDKNIL